MALNITDSHTHLDSEAFDSDREECIERALAAGVTRIITVGASNGIESARRAIELAERYPFVWATVGVHPHDAGMEIDLNELKRLALHPKVVAVGETGLDFFRDWSPVDKQHLYFEHQIDLAIAINKPLVIHSRQAGEQCIETLQRKGAAKVGGVFHCYSEDEKFAARLRELGFLVSFPGFISFKKQLEAHRICREIPLDQIMVETDAPYMAPEPFRGKRCEPSFVVETARHLATLKGLSLEDVAQATTDNALRLFSTMR
jgi:TatD DNase family protein